MKITLTTLFFLFVVHQSCTAQNRDSISVVKNSFYLGTKKLNIKQLLETIRPNPEAYKEMKAAQGNQTVSSIFGFIGGALIGWPIGSAIGGGEPNWTIAAVGAGFVGVAVPFAITGTKRARKAVALYNSGVRGSTSSLPRLNFIVRTNGAGVTFTF